MKFLCGKNVYELDGISQTVNNDGEWVHCFCAKGIEPIEIEFCKPYLFPLSSMTEEQKYDFYCRFIENDCDFDDFKEFYFENNEWHKMLSSIDCRCAAS